jgi:hypothetical protein
MSKVFILRATGEDFITDDDERGAGHNKVAG